MFQVSSHLFFTLGTVLSVTPLTPDEGEEYVLAVPVGLAVCLHIRLHGGRMLPECLKANDIYAVKIQSLGVWKFELPRGENLEG